MPKIEEIQVKTHFNIYTNDTKERIIPAIISIPEAGINENTNMIVLSYGYSGNYQANVFKKIMNEISDKYNYVIVSGYYFGSKYMSNIANILDYSSIDWTPDDIGIIEETLVIPVKGETREEFNDMGIMQALDTIYITLAALNYINKKSHELHNIICFGSSHGGYLCHLANILCPNLFTYLLDISGYIFPYYYKLGFRLIYYGKTALKFRYLINRESELQVDSKLLDLEFLYKTTKSTCKIIAFQGEDDWMVNASEKQSFIDSLGEKATMILFTKEDIDNELISNVDHSLGLNFLTLFNRFIPLLEKYEIKREVLTNSIVNVGQDRLLISYKSGYPIIKFIQMKENSL